MVDVKMSEKSEMDDYVSKPIQKEKVFKTLARVAEKKPVKPSAEIVEDQASTPDAADLPYDREKVLAWVRGNTDLLADILEQAHEVIDSLLAEVGQAVEARSCESLHTSAHALKSVLSNFYAAEAVHAASVLETMGRENHQDSVDDAYVSLCNAVEVLKNSLYELVKE
jgi:HPt (histidine-containing phosphotransfer) domain-containing protein